MFFATFWTSNQWISELREPILIIFCFLESSILGMWKWFFRNLGFLLDSESTFFFSDSDKTPEMNELDIELSKKSKIIEIGSVEKKLQLFKVGGFSKKSENPGIFVQWNRDFAPKTVPDFQNSQNREKVFLIMLFQFWCFGHNFWYTIS